MKIEEIISTLNKKEHQLQVYRNSMNEIDDYFEYRNESASDREFIHEVLHELCLDLMALEAE